jgi:drug/metabolite transporter (DMT)-like permease
VSTVAVWSGIAAIVATATAGDILQAGAMKDIGDLGEIRESSGTVAAVRRVVSNSRFMLGLLFMALAFFSLLVTLSWENVSVVGPASASLTFIANAFAARIFLKERVDHRRWLAALFVAGGVALLAR